MKLHSTMAMALLLLAALAARADSVVTLTGRQSVDYLYYFGGFAISGDEGEAGVPAPVPGGPWEGTPLTTLDPRTLSMQGSDWAPIHYLGWNGWLAETWDQSQTYGLANGNQGAMLTGSGLSAVSQTSQVCGGDGCFLATELHRSTNTQRLDFTLSGSSAYLLSGSTDGGQWVDLLMQDPRSGGWFPVVNGALTTQNRSFSITGTLAAGTYRVRNNPYNFQGGGATDVNNRWDYRLTLADAVVAVPEPAPASLALAGLGLLTGLRAWRRRGWRCRTAAGSRR